MLVGLLGGMLIGAGMALAFTITSVRVNKEQRRRDSQRYVNPRNIHRLHNIEQDDDELVRVLWGDGERSGQ